MTMPRLLANAFGRADTRDRQTNPNEDAA